MADPTWGPGSLTTVRAFASIVSIITATTPKSAISCATIATAYISNQISTNLSPAQHKNYVLTWLNKSKISNKRKRCPARIAEELANSKKSPPTPSGKQQSTFKSDKEYTKKDLRKVSKCHKGRYTVKKRIEQLRNVCNAEEKVVFIALWIAVHMDATNAHIQG